MGWDCGLDYVKTYKRILNHYKKIAKNDLQKGYDIILLTQLRNGSRISEAIEFLTKISKSTKDFKIQDEVRVRKCRKYKTRIMILPEEFHKEKWQILRLHYVFANATNDKLSHYAKTHFGFNTHSLRYAFISHLAKLGIQPQLIAKITQHSRLEPILNYTSQVVANEILLKINELTLGKK